MKALQHSATILGYTSVKPKQQEVVVSFVSGSDVFVSLPTGNGKSFCYGCLPVVFKELREKHSIVIIVSPALMKDQVKSFGRLRRTHPAFWASIYPNSNS